LRRSATDAEQVLWFALRDLNPAFKVRRQHPIGPYIADVAIPAHKLVIEIDGGQHASTLDSDAERTLELNARGYRVIRFWNNDVLGNLNGVLETIIAAIEAPPPHPDPLRARGRRGK
jgi:very-short-patch-repair endonuclease